MLYLIFHSFMQIFRLLFPYWASGILMGTFLSIFFTRHIAEYVTKYDDGKWKGIRYAIASFIGVLSPICMYGTIPILVSLRKKRISEPLLVAYMVGSILLNPNLIILTMALGIEVAALRMLVAVLAGMSAGLIVDLYLGRTNEVFYKDIDFEYHSKSQSIKNPVRRYFYGLNRTVVKTVPYFFTGILITVLIEQYIPLELMTAFFTNSGGLSVLVATMLGIPLYACGGGTIPILRVLMTSGLPLGSALAFMVSGPMTKINNIGAVKMILGLRHFTYYLIFAVSFAVLTGFVTNGIMSLMF